MSGQHARGRPQASSRETLQEAAFELFLENGYARTTVEHIAQRAGVSRNTFFNYFPGKSDVFWIDLDSALIALDSELAQDAGDISAMTAVHDAIISVAHQFGPQRVPWALTQHDMVGDIPELYSAAVSRLARLVSSVARYLSAQGNGPLTPMMAQAAAWAIIGAAVAAVQSWAAAGTSRGELAHYVTLALEPACRAFEATANTSVVRVGG